MQMHTVNARVGNFALYTTTKLFLKNITLSHTVHNRKCTVCVMYNVNICCREQTLALECPVCVCARENNRLSQVTSTPSIFV